jgi:hypothetical protein
MIDSWFSEYKAQAMRNFVDSWASDLPTYRETMIQLAKLERMAQDFERQFPLAVLAIAGKLGKLGKTQGQHKHRLHQQNKLVDRVIRKLIEEKIISDNKHKQLTANKIRGTVKACVEAINGDCHKKMTETLHRVGLLERIKGLDKPGAQRKLGPPQKSRSGGRTKPSSRRPRKLKA